MPTSSLTVLDAFSTLKATLKTSPAVLDAFSTGYASEGPSLATLSIGELDPSHLRDSPDSGFTCPPPGAIEVGIDPAHFLLDVASAVSGAGLLVQKVRWRRGGVGEVEWACWCTW